MNTLMYEHPLTAEHLRIVREVIQYHVVGPIGKNLACGDVGKPSASSSSSSSFLMHTGLGAMTEWLDIVKIVANRFDLQRTGSGFSG